MSKAETIVGFGVLSIGALLLLGTIKMPYFLEGVPGPGFLPLWLSLGLVATGGMLTIKGIWPGPLPKAEVIWPGWVAWRKNGILLSALAISFLLLDLLGFLVTTALFVAAVAFGLGTRSWRILASVPLMTAIVLYGVFAVWLRVPLPRGILAFFD
jgi:putative tricarboxylic transport membrane protein